MGQRLPCCVHLASPATCPWLHQERAAGTPTAPEETGRGPGTEGPVTSSVPPTRWLLAPGLFPLGSQGGASGGGSLSCVGPHSLKGGLCHGGHSHPVQGMSGALALPHPEVGAKGGGAQ